MYPSQQKYRIAGVIAFFVSGAVGVALGAVLVVRNCVEDYGTSGSCTYSAIILTGGCICILLSFGIAIYIYMMKKRNTGDNYLHMTAMQQAPPPTFYSAPYPSQTYPHPPGGPGYGSQAMAAYPPLSNNAYGNNPALVVGVPATGIPVSPHQYPTQATTPFGAPSLHSYPPPP